MICINMYVLNMFTFGKILEKHSSSSSGKPIWGRNFSVIIFKIPAETYIPVKKSTHAKKQAVRNTKKKLTYMIIPTRRLMIQRVKTVKENHSNTENVSRVK